VIELRFKPRQAPILSFPPLQRGNADSDAPASPNAGALPDSHTGAWQIIDTPTHKSI